MFHVYKCISINKPYEFMQWLIHHSKRKKKESKKACVMEYYNNFNAIVYGMVYRAGTRLNHFHVLVTRLKLDLGALCCNSIIVSRKTKTKRSARMKRKCID